ncbi:hypothetical protein TNCV_3321991 [Trichonephila clavipes]|nr:hypothetical protein TNCV_3321991 [Trichonephila clavipes]
MYKSAVQRWKYFGFICKHKPTVTVIKDSHHPLQFSEVSNKSKVVTVTVQYSPFCAAVDESIDEPQPHSNMAVSESNQFNLVDNHRHKRQKFMTDFQRLDDQASKCTTDSVTKFFSVHYAAIQPC